MAAFVEQQRDPEQQPAFHKLQQDLEAARGAWESLAQVHAPPSQPRFLHPDLCFNHRERQEMSFRGRHMTATQDFGRKYTVRD